MAERWQQWYPHEIDAWQGSANVQALSDLAYRAVHNLIQDMWKQDDCALPDDDRELAKRSRVSQRWNECRDEVMEYLTDRTSEGKITHRVLLAKFLEAQKVYQERRMTPEEVAALSASRSAAGKHGNQVRWGKSRKDIANTSQTSQVATVAIANDRLTLQVHKQEQLQEQEQVLERLAPEMLAKSVQIETGILTDRAFRVLYDVCKREQTFVEDDNAIIAAMVAAWKDFGEAKSRQELEFTPGAEKFFGEGEMWKNKAAWPWKAGKGPAAKPKRVYLNA